MLPMPKPPPERNPMLAGERGVTLNLKLRPEPQNTWVILFIQTFRTPVFHR